ncbi:hypothetical protein [Qiania dongpingensis]|uniref:Uncharacterized protein n=1 Tax=Qiania dongpingensis TaxID=2763669 RepID=A0A7G9G380_9FIRM|nr:hypothetical protein [Qiania dongpingensis]QNM05262.1 hypothetical protein H9Q78_12575 [Qiania dongpingensis]
MLWYIQGNGFENKWTFSIAPAEVPGRHDYGSLAMQGPLYPRFGSTAHMSTGNLDDFLYPFLPPFAWGTPVAALRRSPLGRPGIFLPAPCLPHYTG